MCMLKKGKTLEDNAMLKHYVRNKLYYGTYYEDCPVKGDDLSKIEDKYFMTTRQDRLFVFLSESLLSAMGINRHVVAYEEVREPEMARNN